MWEITHLGGEEEDCGSAEGGDAGVAKEWREGECEGEGCKGEEDEKSQNESLYVLPREAINRVVCESRGAWSLRASSRCEAYALGVGVAR